LNAEKANFTLQKIGVIKIKSQNVAIGQIKLCLFFQVENLICLLKITCFQSAPGAAARGGFRYCLNLFKFNISRRSLRALLFFGLICFLEMAPAAVKSAEWRVKTDDAEL